MSLKLRIAFDTEKDSLMEIYEEIVSMSQDQANPDSLLIKQIIDALKKREKLTFFSDEKSKLLPAKNWPLLDAKRIASRETAYYAIVKGIEQFPLDIKEVVSYHEFLSIS